MKTKHAIILIITICLTWFCFWYFTNDPDLMRQNKELIKERDVLKEANKQLSYKIDSLGKVELKIERKAIKIKKQIKDKDYETDSAINNIYTLDDKKLDSIIRAYKHKERK